MPIYKKKNENFFKKWSLEMAYVLGFFAADGCMIKNKRRAHFIEFQITDKDLLLKIKKTLGSNHKISVRREIENCKKRYRLQIGSKKYFDDLKNLGFTERKSKIIEMPKIPKKYLAHFVRGYFDGDGNIYTNRYWRSDRNRFSRTLLVGFTSGSKAILEELHVALAVADIVNGGSLHFSSGAYRLNYSVKDGCNLYKYMYNNCGDLYLARKKKKFVEFFRYLNKKLGR
jgi:intein-encoded DNA endonuclease-like protein